MPRLPAVLEDSTALDGARIDVPVRIGWLLRCSRTARDVDLRTMAARLADLGVPASAASLSRMETEGTRIGTVIDAYEQVLGLDDGHLRGAIDAVCRTFDYSPEDRSPLGDPLTLTEFDALVAAVTAEKPTGGDWLRFALEHSTPRGYGLTSTTMRPLVRKLASELSRSVGCAFLPRYEALARLRCSAYTDVVGDVVRERVLAPDVQVLYDVVSAVSEHPTVELLTWAGELLSHDDLLRVRAGDIVVQSIRAVGGIPDEAWSDFDEPFLVAYERAHGDQVRREVLTRLFRNLPAPHRERLRARLPQPLEPLRGPQDWTRTRRNTHFSIASQLAALACVEAGLPEEPMLARLLFETVFDFRGPRSACAAVVVLASPFADAVHAQLCRAAVDASDPETAAELLSAAGRVQTRSARPALGHWLTSSDPGPLRAAYALIGHAGQLLSDEHLEHGLSGAGSCVREVLYAAGMAGDLRLQAISLDRRRPAAVRAGAAYWVREGSRILR